MAQSVHSSLDPFDAEYLLNPYPHLEALRDEGPVAYLDKYKVFAVARHAECAAILTDPQTFCSGRGVGLQDFAKLDPPRPPGSVLEADPPEHTRTHRAMMKVLSRNRIESLREEFSGIAEKIVTACIAKGTIEGMDEIAREFPLRAFPDALGILKEGRENLLPFGNLGFNSFGPKNERFEASRVHFERMWGWVNACCERENLAPGSMGQDFYALADAGDITHREAFFLVQGLIAAGLDTTINVIGNALYCFATYPEEWSKIREKTSLIKTAIDEVCRFESPVHAFFRTTTRDTTVADCPIPKDEKVLVFMASANRDPRRWERADQFDVTRRSTGHIAFGHGIHRCVGEMLAKVETEVLFTKLAASVVSFTFPSPPEWRLNNTLRGFERLPLTLSPE